MKSESLDSKQLDLSFIMKLVNMLVLKKIVIFIDEMTYNSQTYLEYLRVKCTKDVISNRSSKKTTHSIIAASDFNEVILFRVYNTTVDSNTFGSFLICLIDYYNKKRISLDDIVFVMDNAPTHKANKILATVPFIHLLWLPPYCPHLNFIQRVFSYWKAHIKKRVYQGWYFSSATITLQSLQLVSKDSWYRKCIDQFDVYYDTLQDGLEQKSIEKLWINRRLRAFKDVNKVFGIVF